MPLSNMISVYLFTLLASLTISAHNNNEQELPSESEPPPNIMLIMMDDLGFTDTSINGGIFSTPILQQLADNGIKLNFHYSNTLCSTSRSSLLTGRYSWRTGVNKLVKPFTMQHTDESIAYISEILSVEGNYNTAMFGKWHLGYSSQSFLPFNRGFEKAIFFQSGAIGYTSHQDCIPWYWALKGIPIELELRNLLQNKFIDGFCSYDLWNENYENIENNHIYSEQLYTQNILKYIDDIQYDENDNPFFIYYAMQTPHWPLELPPKFYADCEEPHIHNHERSIFCNALLYGDEMIGNIVGRLRADDLYKNTIIIFLSDNGPNTNWGNKGFGQALPLRGAKGSTFEGGIRTPAIIGGGYVERHCTQKIGTTYNDMVHITDWYPMIKSLAGINTDDDDDDEDIDGINLWPAICGEYSDHDEIEKREDIMYFVMNDVEDKEEGFGPSYIRTQEWKLTINASQRYDGNKAYQYWVDFDNSFVPHPPKKLYNKIANVENNKLYKSQCYDDYLSSDKVESDNVLDVEGTDFEYSEIMLFKINDDRIEACNVAKLYPKVVQHLMNLLLSDDNINEYGDYNINDKLPSKQGALAQIESYDCNEKTSYHLAWNEMDKYSLEADGQLFSWSDIYHEYVDIVEDCYIKHNHHHNNNNNNNNHQQMIIMIIMLLSTAILIYFMSKYCKNKLLSNNVGNKSVEKVTDVTPLLQI